MTGQTLFMLPRRTFKVGFTATCLFFCATYLSKDNVALYITVAVPFIASLFLLYANFKKRTFKNTLRDINKLFASTACNTIALVTLVLLLFSARIRALNADIGYIFYGVGIVLLACHIIRSERIEKIKDGEKS